MRTLSLKHIIINSIFSLGFIVLITSVIKAQDPVYSQFYHAPLQLNPAFAGNTSAPTFNINYRNQWPNLDNAYITFSGSYDQYFRKMSSGIGAWLLNDSAGDGILKTTKVGGVYSYRIILQGDMQMKLGIEASYVQLRLDWDRLIFFDQLDPQFGSVTPGGSPIPSQEVRPDDLSSSYLDIGSGVLLFNPLFYVGISLKHLNNPSQSFIGNQGSSDKLNTRFSLHGGFQISFDRGNKKDEGSFITPNVLYVRQADFAQLNVGAYTGLNNFFAGLWYRHAFGNPDALIVSAGLKMGSLKIGYSYDYTVSNLGIGSGGTHEIGMLISLDHLADRPSKYNDCFSLFR